MFKKILAVGLIATAALGLSSCVDKTPGPVVGSNDSLELTLGEENKSISQKVNVVLQYYDSKQAVPSMGITVRKTGGIEVANVNYQYKALTPTWKAISDELKIEFEDLTDHTVTGGNNGQLNLFNDDKYLNADLFYNTSSNLITIQDKLEPLNKYLGYMPNYQKFLQESKQVQDQLRASDKNIYIAPYFDGLDDIEKMFLMNVDYVRALLDDNPSYYKDNINPVYAPKASALDEDYVFTSFSAYKPYVKEYKNAKIDVVNKAGNGKEQITLNMSVNNDIITKMNAVSVKNGKNLVTALKAHIDEVYSGLIGAGKLYPQRSDIFTSAQACYNADQYIALLRCVKANPKYLTGTASIDPFVTRDYNANRQHALASLAQMWGVRGGDAEKDKLYFDKNGVLQDGRTTLATYDALINVRYMFEEALITQEIDSSSYSASVKLQTGQAFAGYDYNATQTVNNYSHNTKFATTSYMPILPPVARWDDGSSTEYSRFTEDTRQLKTEGWALLKRESRTDAETIRCLTLIDAFYDRYADGYDASKGTSIADLQDYGPNNSYFRNGTFKVVDQGKEINVVNIANYVWETNQNTGVNNWNVFYRTYVGSTLGVGHIRSMGLDYQATSIVGRVGLDNLNLAVKYDVVKRATSVGKDFFKSVPTLWALTPAENTAINAEAEVVKLTDFWKESSSTFTAYATVVKFGWENAPSVSSLAELKAAFEGSNTKYLGTYREVYEFSLTASE